MRLKEKEVSIQARFFFAKVVLQTNLIADNKQEDECKSCVFFFLEEIFTFGFLGLTFFFTFHG
jgi:hypothetical protein